MTGVLLLNFPMLSEKDCQSSGEGGQQPFLTSKIHHHSAGIQVFGLVFQIYFFTALSC
jgi:hypothetical protein